MVERNKRILVLGLDGAEPSILFPMAESGALPNLGRLIGEGVSGRLRSVTPPMTLPAWSTFLTGVNPGRHGITDFTRRVTGSYAQRFLTQRDRLVPTIFERWSAVDRRVVSLLFPTTWPPNPINGIQVAGFDSPIATGMDRTFTWPRAVMQRIEKTVGAIPFADFQEMDIGMEWYPKAYQRLLDAIDRKERFCLELLDDEPWDLFAVLFGEIDTASHHFWFLSDPHSPRHDPDLAAKLGDVISAVYRRVDEAVGRLIDAGDFDMVCVASDHGFGGASDRIVYLNRLLAEWGYLNFRGQPRARQARNLIARVLPTKVAERVFRHAPAGLKGQWEGRARVGGLDLGRTLAWSDELNYAPSIWIHRAPRDPEGPHLDDHALADLEAEITQRLLAARDPYDGGPLVSKVIPARTILDGPALAWSPDLFLELRTPGGYSWNVLSSDGPGPWSERMSKDRHGGAKGQGMNGSHRNDGVWTIWGAEIPHQKDVSARIGQLAPTLCALAGVSRAGMEESEIPAVFQGGDSRDVVHTSVRSEERFQTSETSDEISREAGKALEERLRALGYWG